MEDSHRSDLNARATSELGAFDLAHAPNQVFLFGVVLVVQILLFSISSVS